MGAEMKWPGGALERADRARMDVEGDPEIRPDNRPSRRQMQVARLVRRYRLPRQRALILAGLVFGEGREQ